MNQHLSNSKCHLSQKKFPLVIVRSRFLVLLSVASKPSIFKISGFDTKMLNPQGMMRKNAIEIIRNGFNSQKCYRIPRFQNMEGFDAQFDDGRRSKQVTV